MTNNCDTMDSQKSVKNSVHKLRVSFKLFDTENSGEVGAKELGTVLRSLGLKPTDAELQEMCASGSVVRVTEHISEDMACVIEMRTEVEASEAEMEVKTAGRNAELRRRGSFFRGNSFESVETSPEEEEVVKDEFEQEKAMLDARKKDVDSMELQVPCCAELIQLRFDLIGTCRCGVRTQQPFTISGGNSRGTTVACEITRNLSKAPSGAARLQSNNGLSYFDTANGSARN